MRSIEDLFQDRRYQFWILQLLGWNGWITLFSLRDSYWGHHLESLPILVMDALVGLLLTTGLRYTYRAIWDHPVWFRVIAVLVLCYLAAAIWQPFKNYTAALWEDEFKMFAEYGWIGYFSGILGYSYFVMLGWSGLYFGLKFYRMFEEEHQRSLRLEAMAHEAELRMLRYQLNPHFLFNTLNAISTLIMDRDNETANAMVTRLSSFLRYSLDKDPMQKVDLEHELNALRLYLEIENVRFAERLTVSYEIDEPAKKALVPSLLLQPLVENAIKYAVAPRESGGTIIIRGTVSGEVLTVAVCDDGPGIEGLATEPPQFHGVGIANTRERLAELYGARQQCSLKNLSPHGLAVELQLPFETEVSG